MGIYYQEISGNFYGFYEVRNERKKGNFNLGNSIDQHIIPFILVDEFKML
jgi:hypothetical protein